MSKFKLVYYVSTVLLTAIACFSAGMYFFRHEHIVEAFTKLDYPTYLIYPMAIAKLTGLVVIWSGKWKTLKEWAYAGFAINFTLAFFAHWMISDGEHIPAMLAITFLSASYLSWKMSNRTTGEMPTNIEMA